MGAKIARLVLEKPGFALAGVYARRRQRAGMDAGQALGLDRMLGLFVSPDLTTVIEHSRPHVAIQATCSRLSDAVTEIFPLVRRRVSVISIAEEMAYPACASPSLAQELQQLARFRRVIEATRSYGIEVRHIANSAAILDLPDSHLDAVRPGIAIYGLRPSAEIANPRVHTLEPVLAWKTRISFLKEVPAGSGLSYGHTFHTTRPSLIATIPVGYGDGLRRNLSNQLAVLVRGERCPQVGRITMDMSLIDVTALRGLVELGDEVVLIGRQGEEEITADELAGTLGTINYEVVTAISHRVPRVAI
jgi:alanine racemase